MIKLLIADDHPIVRKGLKQALSEASDIRDIDEASNGCEVFERLEKGKYDVILLDISMPGKSGVDILKQIKIKKIKTPILMLSTHPEEQYALRSLKAGASGYLTKNADTTELIAAIRKVASGGKYISDTLAEQLAFDIMGDSDQPIHKSLSDREYEVLIKIASGKAVSDVADEMNLSVKTISTYRARILEKMNMKNNAEMTHYAIKNKLVD